MSYLNMFGYIYDLETNPYNNTLSPGSPVGRGQNRDDKEGEIWLTMRS